MHIPDDLRYSKEHEWVRVDGDVATVGITDYAQEQLGDVVYVEFPEEGESVTKQETFGVVESVKAVSDCYAPITGKVLEINTPLTDSPETVNEDPYGEGWLLRVEIEDAAELEELMDHEQYAAFVKEEAE